MTRTGLPNRRPNVTVSVPHRDASYVVTFGYDKRPDRDKTARICEAFCDSPKDGSDSQAVVRDGCILISHLLQRGMTIGEIAGALGEDRGEGMKDGPPSSLLGAIARAGASA